MSLGAFLGIVLRRWTWVCAVTALGVALAVLGIATSTRTYSATASIFFSLEYGASASDLAQGATFTQNQVASYALMARTPSVLEPVIRKEHLNTTVHALAGRVSASVVPDTVLVNISVRDPSPARAAALSNDIAAQLSHTVEQLAPRTEAGDPAIRATTVAPADVPQSPVSPRRSLELAVGLLAGLLAGSLAAVARDLTDTRVRSVEHVEAITPLPVLATLDTAPTPDGRRSVVVSTAPRSPEAEDYRALRTAVQFASEPGKALSILVTSCRAAEGKSTVAANLAIALAEAGQRVVLVDADLRRPSLASTFGLEGRAGLTSVLIGRAGVDDVLQPWGSDRLHLLATGPLPPNPSELLASPAMRSTLAILERDHDVIVFDSPPLLAVTDAVVLARVVSGTLIVGNSTTLRRKELRAAITLLQRASARVVGLVLTHVRKRDVEVYGYASAEQSNQGALTAQALPRVSRLVPERWSGSDRRQGVSRRGNRKKRPDTVLR